MVDSDSIEPIYTISSKGHLQLCVDDYIFSKLVAKAKKVYWRCLQRKSIGLVMIRLYLIKPTLTV